MIITRSPLRTSLGGGGTDLPSYYRNHGGFLIAAAIDKYIYISPAATNRATALFCCRSQRSCSAEFSIAGGRGSTTGAVFGALTLTIIGRLLYFANLSSFYQSLINGVILIAVVGLATVRQRLAKLWWAQRDAR